MCQHRRRAVTPVSRPSRFCPRRVRRCSVVSSQVLLLMMKEPQTSEPPHECQRRTRTRSECQRGGRAPGLAGIDRGGFRRRRNQPGSGTSSAEVRRRVVRLVPLGAGEGGSVGRRIERKCFVRGIVDTSNVSSEGTCYKGGMGILPAG